MTRCLAAEGAGHVRLSPLLAIGMYGHAYYLDFSAKAGAYVAAFMAR